MAKITGIVAATEMELEPFLENGLPAHIKTCITGIGSAATAYAVTDFINEFKPAMLIQAGIAGCFNKEILLSSFYVVKKDCFADLGVMEKNKWHDMFDMGLNNRDQYPYSKGWLVNHTKFPFFENDHAVTGITVNEITTAVSKNETWLARYQPLLETLEGAAFHYVCLMKKIPFIQVRTVSNYVGERDKNNWEIEKAILHLNKRLLAVLPAITKSIV